MIKLITAALSIGLLGASPALATSEITEQEKTDHENLLSLVEAVGVPVKFTGWPCDKGWHGGYNFDGSAFIICANKQVDLAEKLDTIRHEAWHLYQDLRDCSIRDKAVLQPVFTAGVVSPNFISVAAKHYPNSHVTTEAEAAWAANTFSAEQINILMFSKAKSCGFRF